MGTTPMRKYEKASRSVRRRITIRNRAAAPRQSRMRPRPRSPLDEEPEQPFSGRVFASTTPAIAATAKTPNQMRVDFRSATVRVF